MPTAILKGGARKASSTSRRDRVGALVEYVDILMEQLIYDVARDKHENELPRSHEPEYQRSGIACQTRCTDNHTTGTFDQAPHEWA